MTTFNIRVAPEELEHWKAVAQAEGTTVSERIRVTMKQENTLLAKAGFADPDRKEPMHDLAVGYIAANASALYATLMPQIAPARATVEREWCIAKGQGQYRSVVGFLDLRFHDLGVEVKWGPFSVADAIRQITFYREFATACNVPYAFVLATPAQLLADECAALKEKEIWYVQLDEKRILDWASAQSMGEPTLRL